MSHPLQGVRILELGQIIAGTYGDQVLSDLGAEVIKIEAPQGDLGRNPFVAPYRGLSGLFLTFNRNKKSVVINLKNDAGRQLFYDLVKLSDVVVDNFRPGVLERLQIDYPTLCQLNPRIIQCSVTGFGGAGAYRDYPALDISIQAMAGHMAVTGEPGRPPVRVGVPLADLSGGIFTCQGVLAALFDRERTGRGRRIDISLFDAMLHLLSYMGTMWLTNGELPKPPGSAHDYTVPWQAFATSDGYIVLAAREPPVWRRLCQVLEEPGLVDDPRFATAADRVHNRAILIPYLERIFRKRTAAEWITLLRAADVPVAPVNHFDKAFAEPPVAEREMIVEYDHPDVGKVRLPGNPIKMSGMTGTISKPAPRLGEHTDMVLSEMLALPAEEIDKLRRQGAIG
ncbi:MAG: CoA transferase [Candidatus Korobacteraceae bacterium]|jgi:crotonobetainyl-CoA:carnitine CoA-transferase CaiB-like acyl-CoA transferase